MKYIVEVDPRVKVPEEVMAKTWNFPAFVKFTGDVEEESGKAFREHLEAAEDAALRAKQEVIPIVIDSFGGDCYSLFGMIDAIRNCSLKVATIIESKVMSAGVFLFSCGTEGYRYIGSNATLMIHTISLADHGKIDEIKASAEEGERINQKLFKMMAKNCGHKKEDYFLNILKQRNMADWYLDANDAVKHKLANRIHIPTMKVNVDLTHNFK